MNIHIWHPNKKQIFYEVFIVNIKQYHDSHDTLIKLNHYANYYLGDKFISLWQIIIALIYIVLCLL
jgi:hypothetical protein